MNNGDFLRELGRQLDEKAAEIERLKFALQLAHEQKESGYRHAAIRLAAMVADLLSGIFEADYDPRPWSCRTERTNLTARAEYLRTLCGLSRRPDPTVPRTAL